jgi:hypothetical protein
MKVTNIYIFFSLLFSTNYVLANATQCGISDNVPYGNQIANNIFKHTKSGIIPNPSDKQKPGDFISVDQQPAPYTASGNGLADDTGSLQHALDGGNKIWLSSNKIYRISKKLNLRTGNAIKSDGTATILMSKEGFKNPLIISPENTTSIPPQPIKKEVQSIYGERATGLEIIGTNIEVEDIFVVKEYEDAQYVIAILITSADAALAATNKVTINRVRIRGFSLAPGIISINSAKEVTISNSLIHASCSKSKTIPDDLNKFQITGITVDDARETLLNKNSPEPSEKIIIKNNVIVDLFMEDVPRQAQTNPRPEQTDGINFQGAGNQTNNNGTIISQNYINGVAEGIDLFGSHIEVSENMIGARQQGIKLIHGARNLTINNNYIWGKFNYKNLDTNEIVSLAGIGIWDDGYSDQRPNNIVISNNFIDQQYTNSPGIFVSPYNGHSSPHDITLIDNRFSLSSCSMEAIICNTYEQCKVTANNEKLFNGVYACN